MIITAPLRRMILHLSQRGLTDVRIFILQSHRKRSALAGHSTTSRQKAANLLTLPHRRLDLPLNLLTDRLDIPRTVDLAQDAALAVVLDHRHRVLNVDLDAR